MPKGELVIMKNHEWVTFKEASFTEEEASFTEEVVSFTEEVVRFL